MIFPLTKSWVVKITKLPLKLKNEEVTLRYSIKVLIKFTWPHSIIFFFFSYFCMFLVFLMFLAFLVFLFFKKKKIIWKCKFKLRRCKRRCLQCTILLENNVMPNQRHRFDPVLHSIFILCEMQWELTFWTWMYICDIWFGHESMVRRHMMCINDMRYVMIEIELNATTNGNQMHCHEIKCGDRTCCTTSCLCTRLEDQVEM